MRKEILIVQEGSVEDVVYQRVSTNRLVLFYFNYDVSGQKELLLSHQTQPTLARFVKLLPLVL
jgi:hypothetical protein